MTSTLPHSTNDLYWDMRGTGPTVLLVPGTPGDGGQFDATGAALAERYTVVCYDRRGTSRSLAPPAWNSTSVAEQADDAARVLAASGSVAALVYGTSNGASVALELALRHPRLVRLAILHEMPLLSVLADAAPVGEMIGSLIEAGMAHGGPTAALDAFLRFAFGDDVVDAWEPAFRERLLANAEMVFGVELPAFQAYRPDEALLRASTVPIEVAVGTEQEAPFFAEAASWLAKRVGSRVHAWPGAHGPQFACPDELAHAITALDVR